jgi:hypothetical protein
MLGIRKYRSVRDAIAAQTVRDEAPRLVFQSAQQALEETLGSGTVPPTPAQPAGEVGAGLRAPVADTLVDHYDPSLETLGTAMRVCRERTTSNGSAELHRR